MTDNEELARPVFVCFDGPPGPEAGRFIEVENADGKSVRAGEWEQEGDYWYLGPFYREPPDVYALRAQVAALQAELKAAFWECPNCAFAFSAKHTLADGTFSCPVCAETRLQAESAELAAKVVVMQGALRTLVLDVQDYAAWQRPCFAVQQAQETLATLPARAALLGDLVEAAERARSVAVNPSSPDEKIDAVLLDLFTASSALAAYRGQP